MQPQAFVVVLPIYPALTISAEASLRTRTSYPSASPFVQLRVSRNADDGHGVYEYPCAGNPDIEDLVAQTSAFDDGKEGVQGNAEYEDAGSQVAC